MTSKENSQDSLQAEQTREANKDALVPQPLADNDENTQSVAPRNEPLNVNTSPKKKKERKCSRSERSETGNARCHAMLEDACTATRMTVLGRLPRPRHDEDGNVMFDKHGSVMFDAVFERHRERGSKWTDDWLLRLMHGLPTLKHARFLAAIQAMTNSFDFADCKPLGTWDSKGNFVPDGDDLLQSECRWSVPTLCVRVVDLSFENVSRFLHPSMEMVHRQMKADAERAGMMFGGEEDELYVDRFTEAEFDDIVTWFVRWGLLHITETENGTRPARLNSLSMAQCTPTMKPTLLQGSPVQGMVTPRKVTEGGFTGKGDVKADTKETHGGITWYRRRSKELVAEKRNLRTERDEERTMRKTAEERVERQSELFEVQEEIHAQQRNADRDKLNTLRDLFKHALSIIDGDEPPAQKVDALASAFIISDTEYTDADERKHV